VSAKSANKAAVSIDYYRLPWLVDPLLDFIIDIELTITLGMSFSSFRFYLFVCEGTLKMMLQTLAASEVVLICRAVSSYVDS
jgi:hypothetical protein